MARAARKLGIRLHTHLVARRRTTCVFCREKFNCKPVEFVADHDWLGRGRVVRAHGASSESEIRMMAETRTGTAHCPRRTAASAAASPRAPELARAGAPVSLGVDGSASNEAGDWLSEAHACWYTHRALKGAGSMTIEEVMHWGTQGGARVLGIDNIGALEVGRAADIAVYDLAEPRYAGLHDPAIGPVASGGDPRLRLATVQGRVVVENGAIPGLDLPRLLARAREAVRRLG